MNFNFKTNHGNEQHTFDIDKYGSAFVDGRQVYDWKINSEPVKEWNISIDGRLFFNGKNVYEHKLMIAD